jgi:hypothetical protein
VWFHSGTNLEAVLTAMIAQMVSHFLDTVMCVSEWFFYFYLEYMSKIWFLKFQIRKEYWQFSIEVWWKKEDGRKMACMEPS